MPMKVIWHTMVRALLNIERNPLFCYMVIARYKYLLIARRQLISPERGAGTTNAHDRLKETLDLGQWINRGVVIRRRLRIAVSVDF